jgi:membrane protein implicated in regulation of membrane protease activity
MDAVPPDIWTAGLNPWWWLSIGLALLVLEVVLSGFVLLWIGIGAVISGLVFFAVSLQLDMQLVTFAVTSILALVIGRPVLLRRLRGQQEPESGLNDRAVSLIGSTAVLTTALTQGRGRARIADGEWSVRSTVDLPAGSAVRVEAVDGNTLQVSPL